MVKRKVPFCVSMVNYQLLLLNEAMMLLIKRSQDRRIKRSTVHGLRDASPARWA
jgi:hypothetical protein